MFVVEMLRFGDREMHSYVLGVFSVYDLALEVAEAEKEWRGGKYDYEINNFKLNDFSKEELRQYYENAR